MILYGKSLFGRVDRVPGIFYVATKFFHIGYVPLVPMGSWLVFDGTESEKNWKGIRLGWEWRSIGMAWLRTLILAPGVALLLHGVWGAYLHFGSPSGPSLGSAVLEFAGAALLFIGYGLSHRFARASEWRAKQLVLQSGLPPNILEGRFGF